MSLIKPITLADQIYDALKRMILTCELAPGERLVEKQLSETLGVSRASLRESLQRLTQERLVTLKPNCGFSVTPLTEENFRHVCELRRVLESQVAALAAERASPEAIARIREAAVVNCTLSDENAFMIYCDSNRAFHHSIAQSIDNDLLEEIVLSALDKDQQPLYYGIDLEVCTRPEDVTAEHLAIADAIENKESRKAAQLMERHIGEKEERILAALLERTSE